LQVSQSINAFSSSKKTIVTLGTFDGVHLGHKSILNKLIEATENGLYESVVLTFYPHPRLILQQEHSLQLLNSMDEKIMLLEKSGIDHLIIHPFDTAFSKLSAEAFVQEILVTQLQIHKIIIGYDHRFGENRTANITDLIEFGKKYNFEVVQVNAQEINEIAVSSTKIRKALLNGDIKTANNYLGYKYSFNGKVIEGMKNGRTIGYPTANIQIEENYKLIPKNSVYIVSSEINKTLYYGMMNIGTNPTLGENEQTIEIHFFKFNSDIYSQKIKISVVDYIREEQKFESLEALKEQLDKDKDFSIKYLAEHESTFF